MVSGGDVPTAEEIRDEQRRARRVQVIVRLAQVAIEQSRLSRDEAEAVVAAARARVLELFPGRGETFDILYGRRFQRLLAACPAGDARRSSTGRVLPFRQR